MSSEGSQFRFASKREYEEEMKRMLREMRTRDDADTPAGSGSMDDVLSEKYDELVEEYLEFCSV
jgi:hypothetical protein